MGGGDVGHRRQRRFERADVGDGVPLDEHPAVAAQLGGSDAKFMLADAGSPTLIHDTSDENALYVLMPMRV